MSTLPFARCSARVADALGPRQALHGRPRMCANCREWVDGTAVAIRHGHGRLAAPASARTEAEWISWRGERVQAPPHRGHADPRRRQSHAGGARARASADLPPAPHARIRGAHSPGARSVAARERRERARGSSRRRNTARGAHFKGESTLAGVALPKSLTPPLAAV